jgi:hypothetical protein
MSAMVPIEKDALDAPVSIEILARAEVIKAMLDARSWLLDWAASFGL